MDNKLFNVNGKGTEMLKRTLSLAFEQNDSRTCKAWIETKEHGLILMWCKEKDANIFPAELNVDSVIGLVQDWLRGDFAKNVTLSDWCNDCDHDGHNTMGWQVYVGDWGHVGDYSSAICAIKPAFIWHGK